MGITTYVPPASELSSPEMEVRITPVAPTRITPPTSYRPRRSDGYATRGSYSGVGSGGSGGGSSSYTPTQKIPEVKEEPKPKQIPIPKLPPTQKEEEKEIFAISKDPEVYHKFSRSIAPSIYGNDAVKEAISLILFGGIAKIYAGWKLPARRHSHASGR